MSLLLATPAIFHRATVGSGPTLTITTDNLDQDPPAIILDASEAGTVTWDFDASGVTPPAKGAGSIGTGSYAVTAGSNSDTIDLSAYAGETGYLWFRLTVGAEDSTPVVAQEITVPNPNLVVDGSWIQNNASWVESPAGTITATNGTNFGMYQSVLVGGRTYEVSATVSSYTSGTFDMRVGSTTPAGFNATATGTYTATVVANNATLYLMGNGTFNGVVTDISCVDVTP